jgi:feruloyl esterase
MNRKIACIMRQAALLVSPLFVFLPCTFAAGSACDDLAKLALPQTEITIAQVVPAGAFIPPQVQNGRGPSPVFKTLPAFCRVALTTRPTSDSIIKIEVWLPESDWNGRLETIGNGGWNGSIGYNQLAQEVLRGYVVSGTDTGHDTNDSAFTVGHIERLKDFGYRAVHEAAVKAKAVAKARFGQDPKYSYFNGCSTGGRQALNAAQRYPADFNGIIAGAPADPFTGLHAGSLWNAHASHKAPESMIPNEKWPAIHKAVVAACDALDGLKDGLIDDPRKCAWDPREMLCKTGDENTCLTPPQVETMRAIYSGAVNPRTKAQLYPGWPRGAEIGMAFTAGPTPEQNAISTYRAVLQKGDWDWRTLDFDRDVEQATRVGAETINSDPAKLKEFLSRGGKLFMFHGWSDPNISPLETVNYYETAVESMGGASKASDSIRLFLLPGMAHCGGGDGPNMFDKMDVITTWVEQGRAPERIVASHSTSSQVDRTRPLCPYPQVARYKESGSIDDAANFVCSAPKSN